MSPAASRMDRNPLTPIQLSAERLKRRFGQRITDEERKVFDQCTETIVRQVDDIRRMVDEFSGFARMPKPVMENRDLNAVVREAVFLQEVSQPNIRFKLELPETPVFARIDHRLVTQALTNIVKNATESIEAVGGWISNPASSPYRLARRRAQRSSTSRTTARVSRQKIARSCSSLTSRHARRGPASVSRSCERSWRSTAGRSRSSTRARS